MRPLLLILALMSWTLHSRLQSQEQQTTATGHYLFAWSGDAANKGKDFLAVIDADPASKSYGRLMTTLATDQQSVRVHHTEYVMPASGMLFANDHDAGRTFIFDVRDPLHPKTVTSFTDMAGYPARRASRFLLTTRSEAPRPGLVLFFDRCPPDRFR